MSVPPDEASKGLFHRVTGVPFGTMLRGNAGAYRHLENEMTLAAQRRTQQLRLQQDLDTQYQEIAEAQQVVMGQLERNHDDVAQAQLLQREAAQRLDQVDFDGPLSMRPRIPSAVDLLKKAVGLVPYVGTAYTAYQLADYGVQRVDAMQTLEIETQAVRDIQDHGEQLRSQLQQNRGEAERVRQQLEIQRNIVRGLQDAEKKNRQDLSQL